MSALLEQRRPDHSLPQAFYTDQDVFDFDMKAIFERAWTMVGFEIEFPQSGAYIALEIGSAAVIIVRGKDGIIRGFHNSCRHRGARICQEAAGRTPRFVCPYHQWNYDLTGKLLRAAKMADDFIPENHGLVPIHVETVAGCVYASVAKTPLDFSPFRASVERALRPYNLQDAKIAHIGYLEERGNWKLVMENSRECYHCAAGHPEFQKAYPIAIGERGGALEHVDETETTRRLRLLGLDVPSEMNDWWQVARVPLNEGKVTFSVDGGALVSKRLIEQDGRDLGALRWAIEPNNFCHVTVDSAFMFSANPVHPTLTKVTAKWLVHKDAVEGVDYQVADVIRLWDETNMQDRDFIENNQLGVNSAGYIPGPYSPSAEPYVMSFVDWYCKMAREFIANGLTPSSVQSAA
ncbi:aromatic ring-hydroxylating oxygenase subunit alpha [Sphingobium boeckii]|uniref:Rieske 2Fe-2S family protein n=1 Tax=Sphingobium boeckii TaxID=1082345 RepID=A0A7W9AIK3_9SPHN|nr:aromatic ring-hydroxylating dioxygenase subunit alpha [Sphingobium boeckii]MBB5686324.1 Rieske 2Fe-2S family protein [Sphingobium boeckii]